MVNFTFTDLMSFWAGFFRKYGMFLWIEMMIFLLLRIFEVVFAITSVIFWILFWLGDVFAGFWRIFTVFMRFF